MQDSSDILSKTKIRHEALKRLGRRPNVVLDLFAGTGEMTKTIWSAAAERVICIEKDAAKAAQIERAEIIIGDNRDYLHLATNACIIDCDSYGSVMPLIKMLPRGKLVVFTDGTAYAKKKNSHLGFLFERDLRAIFSEYKCIQSGGQTTYYGWGITR